MSKNENLSKEEVNQVLQAFDFLEFANSYKNAAYYNTYYTPDTVNAQMQNINMNPADATIEGLERALQNPKSSEQLLRNYATSYENQNMYYKRLIRYVSDMACFNMTFDCINITKESDFNSKEFKNDLKILDDFSSKFNYREEFAMIVRQMLRQGIFYGVLRNEGNKYSIQELPTDFCKITGRHNYGLLFDFNMQWFIGKYGVDINMYPKVFKKMYNRVFSNIGKEYNPHKDVDSRNSTFIYWTQCSPSDGFWAWKITPELATVIPYYSAIFPDIAVQPIVRKLQEDKYFIEASKLLVGIIGMNKDNKSGNVANQINISPDMLGKFLGVARKGLAKQIGLTALPMDSIEKVEFDTKERNMLTEYIQNVANQSTASSDVLINNDKLNVHQSKLSSAIDANFVKAFYPMFESFVEYYVNRETKKYKFKINFKDVDIPDDIKSRADNFKNFATMGIVDFQLAARTLDMNVFELNRTMSLGKAMGFDKKLMPLLSLNNQTKDSSGNNNPNGGRETKPDSDNESTIASIETGSNLEKDGGD